MKNFKYYDPVEAYVAKSFGLNQVEITHLKRTAHWVRILTPKADEALLIAAVSHDIERAFKEEPVKEIDQPNKSFLDENQLFYHQEKGALLMEEYLGFLKAPDDLTKRVVRLISRHELGGYKDENILKDADSISFFENNVDFFLSVIVQKTTLSVIREKFDWMYHRISLDEAKKFCRPWYETALDRIESISNRST